MCPQLQLEAETGAARIIAAYDDAGTFRFTSEGRLWRALERAHLLGVTGRGCTVAIIDTMCDPDIPVLKAKLRYTPDAAPHPHGTAVALLISHMAPDCSFDIYPMLDGIGQPSMELAGQAVVQATASDAAILNLSLGMPRDFHRPNSGSAVADWVAALNDPHLWMNELSPDDPDCILCPAVEAAVAAGKLVFAAAGNDADSIFCPARVEGVTAVGFQKISRRLASIPGGGTAEISDAGNVSRQSPTFDIAIDEITGVLGTSFASPLYAGIAALGLTQAELSAYLASTRMGTFAHMLHAGLGQASGDAGMIESVGGAYEQALARLPHVHTKIGARLRPDLSLSDPAACWSCGFFAEDKYVNAGLFYAATGRYGEAADLLSAARILMPWSWDAAAGLGALCNVLNRFDDAIKFYEIALRLRPGNAQYLGMIDKIRSRRTSDQPSSDFTSAASIIGATLKP
jgi:tetratricopeptide (TPR) repeat protein